MKLVQLSLKEARQRWEDLEHLHRKSSWPNDVVPNWVNDVRHDHFEDKPLWQVGIGAVEQATLRDIVWSLFEYIKTSTIDVNPEEPAA